MGLSVAGLVVIAGLDAAGGPVDDQLGHLCSFSSGSCGMGGERRGLERAARAEIARTW